MTIQHFKKIFFLLALFISPEVLGATFFDVLPTDKSLEYLGKIFGGSVGVVNLSGDANPMLSRMFERFNFIIVTVGVSILSYVGIAAAINTAREGEAMGKKFSLWVPLRGMLGMLLMVPSPGTGYSVVQMTVMWVVLNGVGAANTIWGVVLDQLASGFKAVGKVEIPIGDSELTPTVKEVMKAATCMQFINNLPNLELTQKYGRVKVMTTFQPVRKIPDPPQAPTIIRQTAFVDVGVEGSPDPTARQLCGHFAIESEVMKGDKFNSFNESTLNTRLSIKVNALLAMFAVLDPAAEQLRIVTPEGARPDYPTPPMPELGYVRQAINVYKSQIANIGAGINNARSSTAGAWEEDSKKISIREEIAVFKRLGWIHAGSYYYAMSKSSANMDADAMARPTIELGTSIQDGSLRDAFMNQVSNNEDSARKLWPAKLYTNLATQDNRLNMDKAIQRALDFAKTDTPAIANSLPALGSGKVSSGNGFVDRILGGISDRIRKPIIEKFQSGFTGKNEDPLISLGRFGWELMLGGEISIFTAIIIAFGISMITSPVACMNPAAYAVNQLLFQVYIVVFSFLVLIWAMGATLGVYVPLIPYIIFTGTAVGWLLAVIEAIVAAPLIALSMVQPGGEELGALKEPLMFLANLFLRPTLMIFGFVIAGSFLRAILTMINFGFSRAIEESVIPTLFGIIPILAIYAGFVIAMINEAFSLIYELPNKVIRYMGGKEESYHPGKTTEGAKGGFESGKQAAHGGMQQAGGLAQGKMKASLEKFKKEDDDKKKNEQG